MMVTVVALPSCPSGGNKPRQRSRWFEEALENPSRSRGRLQKRLDVMYEDRLDGRIDVSLFERKSAECREEQAHILTQIEGFGAADGQYMLSSAM